MQSMKALPWPALLTKPAGNNSRSKNCHREGTAIMMNRRQFVGATAVTFFASVPRAFAATYDLIIKGGRVIDPSTSLDAVRDVAIAGGRIAAVSASITADATDTIDAR